jgi:hypothetical protein
MGLRGPKAKNERDKRRELLFLERTAFDWADFFYTLRDGVIGYARKMEYGPWKEYAVSDWDPVTGKSSQRDSQKYRSRSKKLIHIDRIRETATEAEIRTKLKGEAWLIWYPVKPARELWEQFKNASTLTEHRSVVSKIKKWWKVPGEDRGSFQEATRFAPGWVGKSTSEVAELLASPQLLDAKSLWLYPRGKLRDNDDDRIEFFAKAAAGVMWGMAPATASRKLTGIDISRHVLTKSIQKHIEVIKAELARTPPRTSPPQP